MRRKLVRDKQQGGARAQDARIRALGQPRPRSKHYRRDQADRQTGQLQASQPKEGWDALRIVGQPFPDLRRQRRYRRDRSDRTRHHRAGQARTRTSGVGDDRQCLPRRHNRIFKRPENNELEPGRGCALWFHRRRGNRPRLRFVCSPRRTRTRPRGRPQDVRDRGAGKLRAAHQKEGRRLVCFLD